VLRQRARRPKVVVRDISDFLIVVFVVVVVLEVVLVVQVVLVVAMVDSKKC
jgi:hypothetical protein